MVMGAGTETISGGSDLLDVRDIIARVEYLENDHTGDCAPADCPDEDEHAEFVALVALLDKLAGNGGDEKWRGSWYPITLVRDSYFEEFAEEEAKELGLIQHDARWPANHIDWEAAATELQQDYSSVEFDDDTYWYR